MRSTFCRLYFAVTLAMLFCQGANAGEIVVISNLETTISADDVEDIYTGEKQFAGSIRLVPVDNAVLQADFLARLLNINTAKYDQIWTRKLFRDGLPQPAMKSGDTEVIAYVKRTPGAIGYVSSTPAGVKIVIKVSAQ